MCNHNRHSHRYDFKAHKKELEAKLRDQEQQLVEKDLQSQKTQAAQERKFIEEKARMQKVRSRRWQTHTDTQTNKQP